MKSHVMTGCFINWVNRYFDIASSLSLQVYPCSNDKECSVGSYCHSPQQAPSRCLTCRRRKKRCHRDAMCCPGNRCSNCTNTHTHTHTRTDACMIVAHFSFNYIMTAGHYRENLISGFIQMFLKKRVLVIEPIYLNNAEHMLSDRTLNYS